MLGNGEPYRYDSLTTRRSPRLASAVRICTLHGFARRLGLYAAVKKVGKGTPAEIAAAAGLHERFVREWLHQQVLSHRRREKPAYQARLWSTW